MEDRGLNPVDPTGYPSSDPDNFLADRWKAHDEKDDDDDSIGERLINITPQGQEIALFRPAVMQDSQRRGDINELVQELPTLTQVFHPPAEGSRRQ